MTTKMTSSPDDGYRVEVLRPTNPGQEWITERNFLTLSEARSLSQRLGASGTPTRIKHESQY